MRVAVPDFGVEPGMDALAIAASCCAQRHVHNVVVLLLCAGSDPNATSVNGTTPLIAAVCYQNLGGVRALLTCANDGSLDLEKGLLTNNATALHLAAYMSTFEIFHAVLEAGADRTHL